MSNTDVFADSVQQLERMATEADAGPEVVAQMAEGFENSTGSLAERLLAASRAWTLAPSS